MQEHLDQQIIENIPDFFFIWDLATQDILYLTHGYRHFAKGHLQEQSAYKHILDVVHPDDREQLQEILHSLSADNAYQSHELRVNEEKYKAQWMKLSTFPVEDKPKQPHRIVAHVSDITCRKQQLKTLEEHIEKNENLIRMLAHDLKNPLNNMMMLSALASKEFQKGAAPQGNAMLTKLEEVGEHACRLVENLLGLLELKASTLPVDLKRVDFNALVKNIVQYYLPQAAAYQIQLELQLPAVPLHLTLDAQKFAHVLENLLSNALKFTPRAGHVTVKVEQNEKQVLLSISDTGIGIAEDKQKEIFQEFSPARKKGLHGEKSSGLGLSIARKIVELHQGEIRVESQKGQGTTFTVVLKP